jgi:DNA-directed RNA polymerase I subunit RPA2
MAPTRTDWDHEYQTLRREHLFRHPPRDRSAYPALQSAVAPHIESFNALFHQDGGPTLLDHALVDIGTKEFFDEDGDGSSGALGKNKLSIRIKSVSLQKSEIPSTNKFAARTEIYPAECRERHATYRGKLSSVIEYWINDETRHEQIKDLGHLPIMIRVSLYIYLKLAVARCLMILYSRTNATWRIYRRIGWSV